MKKAILATFTFLAMQAIVPTVGTYLMSVFGEKAGLAVDLQTMPVNPLVVGVELIFTYLLTVAALYAWRYLSPATGLRSGRRCTPLAAGILLLFIVAANIVNEVLGLPDMAAETMPALMGNPLCIVCIALLGPVVEELVFRRAAMGWLLVAGYKPLAALAASAALFAVVHINPAQMPVAFIIGMLLGWFYLRSGSIVVPVVCHILNNTLGVLLFHLAPDARLVSLLGGTVPALLVAAAVLAAAAWLMRIYARLTAANTSAPESILAQVAEIKSVADGNASPGEEPASVGEDTASVVEENISVSQESGAQAEENVSATDDNASAKGENKQD